MILVLIGQDLALEGSTSLNIEDKHVPGTHTHMCMFEILKNIWLLH